MKQSAIIMRTSILIIFFSLFFIRCEQQSDIIAVIENHSDKMVYTRILTYSPNSQGNFFSEIVALEPNEKYLFKFFDKKSYFRWDRLTKFIFMDSDSDGSCNEVVLQDVTLNEAQLRALGWTLKYPLSDADKEIIEEYKTFYEDSNNRQS